MDKETNGYYLEKANIKWLEKTAKAEGRSASNYLDRLITALRKGDRDASKPQ